MTTAAAIVTAGMWGGGLALAGTLGSAAISTWGSGGGGSGGGGSTADFMNMSRDIMGLFPEYDTLTNEQATEAMEGLTNLGSGLIEGDVPDYYKPIGEMGGQMWQNAMVGIRGQVGQGVQENLAAQNLGRGGLAGTITAREMGTQMGQRQMDEYNRALVGRGHLLSTGVNSLQAGGGMGLNREQMRTGYEAQKVATATGSSANLMGMQMNQEAADNAAWGQMMGSAVGTAGNIYGMNVMRDIYSNKNQATAGLGLATLPNTHGATQASLYGISAGMPVT